MFQRLLIAILVLAYSLPVFADRLKDLVEVEGFRDNQLVGYGLVVGLAGSGDETDSVVTKRSLTLLMRQLGITVDQEEIRARNVAAVIVTSSLPPFARSGMQLDVTVSSIGTAKSLQGGTLLMTPLKGADLQTYALAQGSLSVGGFAVEAASGSVKKKSHTTVASIAGGATVERAAPTRISGEEIVLLLKEPDFTTASRIAAAINSSLGDNTAVMRDPGAVVVTVGDKFKGKSAEMVAKLQGLEATPDLPARVVIDERTGTVVIGQYVKLFPAAIAYGSLSIEVNETQNVSQPGPLSEGSTTVTNQSDITVEEKDGKLTALPESATLGDLVSALNALGIKPRDLAPVLRALKAAGALRAEIELL